MKLANTIPICDAFVHLMNPLLEIVIHDFRSGTICYINGGLSKRKIGDPSLLDMNELEENIDKTIYSKLNFDGRLIKSISVPLSDQWLMCINCDISIFSQMQALSNKFLQTSSENQPESLFKSDWQEKLHIGIHRYIQEKQWQFDTLSAAAKKELVKHLFNIGAFHEKNAADYVAKVLNMGRATIFNYLKEFRRNDH